MTTTPPETCPECNYGPDDCPHIVDPIRITRNDQRFIASILTWYSTETPDEKASRRAIDLGRRLR